MTRLKIINYLIEKYKYNTYLEIGVHTGDVLNGCIAKDKIGVDPDYTTYKGDCTLFHGTSDEFFKKLEEEIKYDIIFIDGMHESEQVKRDIKNSFKHLNKNGCIVIHDCNPPTEWHIRNYEEYLKTGGDWNGNVYKGYVEIINSYVHLSNYVINEDWGVGILFPYNGTSIIPMKEFKFTKDWKYFNENRKELLNLISFEEFKKNI